MTSVKITTVASSLVLGSTGPVWAALLGALFLRDRVTRRGAAAIALSLLGVAAMAGGDWGRGGPALLGDALAVAAALFAAGYLTVGRAVRDRLPLAPWLLGVYTIAAAALGLFALAAGVPLWGFDTRTWWMFALLALIPSTLGHNLLNWAVRHMETYKVGLATLVEPVVSSALAALLFAEIPNARFYPGAALTLGGVLLALWPRSAPDYPEVTPKPGP
jgi:drug/metabolite transporter (DMT)-like permease